MNSSEVKDYCLINHETGCQYMFILHAIWNVVLLLFDDGHGWRSYDSAMVGGNYETPLARTFWNSLIKQGFTTND